MTTLRDAAQQALEALEGKRYTACGWRSDCDKAITALRAALAEPDLFHCPKCGGPADNGHDRSIPPSPYWCTKCMAEPVQEPVAWRWGYRSVTTGEMDWRGYVEIPAHPNLRSPAIIMQPLYTAPFPLEAERNFCPRCGKRTNDIHTCTLP